MNKALFGLITVAAFGAIAFLVYNRAVENAARKDKSGTTEVAATKTDSCCAGETIATTKGSSCCSGESCCDVSKAALVSKATECTGSCQHEGGACCQDAKATTAKAACCAACAAGGECCKSKSESAEVTISKTNESDDQ